MDNLGVRQNGQTGAIKSIDIFRELRTANAIYEAELASQLSHRLNLTITALDKGGFGIKGVPQELCQAHSTRSTQVKAEMERHEGKSAKAASYAAHNTRQEKEVLSHEALFARWQKTAREHGFGEEEARKLSDGARRQRSEKADFKAKFQEEVHKAQAKGRTVRGKVEIARKLAITDGVGGGGVRDAIREHLPKKPGFLHVEWREPVPKAPFWSPVKLVKLPRLVLGKSGPKPKWGKIIKEKKTAFGHVRIQERILFPKAPRISPFHGMKLRALRYGKMRLREDELWGKIHSKKDLKVGEVRIQERRLFPRALKWNPLKNMTVRVPRFVAKNQKEQQETKAKRAANEQSH